MLVVNLPRLRTRYLPTRLAASGLDGELVMATVMLTWARLRAVTKLHVERCQSCQVYPYGWMAYGEVALCEAGIGIQYSHTAAVA